MRFVFRYHIFIFGDREPFIGCIEDLDKAFNWAEKYGLKILIDLHTAPEGQNGSDNGGICGVCKWAQNPEEVEFVHTVLERLAQRYGHREGLWGIELINEPALQGAWELLNIQKRYSTGRRGDGERKRSDHRGIHPKVLSGCV